jgi:hypothetical protein
MSTSNADYSPWLGVCWYTPALKRRYARRSYMPWLFRHVEAVLATILALSCIMAVDGALS